MIGLWTSSRLRLMPSLDGWPGRAQKPDANFLTTHLDERF
ncbi:hypothetical protein Talka_01589 [Tepidimonas alkaliphilus]|uniref:Uncharacterized protein n=1 Tax=Tepidimonas alkaliphilus TaxID=2588942 RepID=A0A554W7G6_9BURK|nr:hypothetical protein Talka_01589 [Tepidimonas alkaliphilus]